MDPEQTTATRNALWTYTNDTPTNPNTDWDRWIKDSEDPEPFVPDPGYNAIFGGSIYNPWAGPGTNGRGTESEAPAANAASEAFQGNGKAPDLARSFMASIPSGGNGAGQGSARSMSEDCGRSMKYVTRIILDGSLPAVVVKGDPFTVTGHVEYTTVQVDDGNNNDNNGNNGNDGLGPGGGDGYDNGHVDNPWDGQGPGGGHGGSGPDPGSGGSDLPIFYWYWWHGPADTGGRGGVSGRSGDELKWYPIDQAMAIRIQLNTTQGNYKIGSGLADQQVGDVYGHFTITCIIPGAAPAGEGKIAISAIANSYYAGCWWEEGRDG